MSEDMKASRSYDPAQDKPSYFHRDSIGTHSAKDVSDTKHDDFQSTSLSPKQRMGFWSKFKRSKSQNDNHSTKATAIPQRAKADANLVWSPDQKIWLFDRPHTTDKEQPPSYTSQEPREKSKPKRKSALLHQCDDEYDEDEFLSAQLPGHYFPGCSYQSSTYESVNRRKLGFYSCVERTSVTESKWMAVAERVGSEDPLP